MDAYCNDLNNLLLKIKSYLVKILVRRNLFLISRVLMIYLNI